MSELKDSQGLKIENLIEENISQEDDCEEEEGETPAEILKIMNMALLNEIVAPKILLSKYLYAEALVDQLEHMEKNIEREPDKTKLKITIHRMELYRISYILNSYFRTRLKKIENCPQECLEEHLRLMKTSNKELLDEKECNFANGYMLASSSLFKDEFLQMLPTGLQSLPVVLKFPTARKSRVFIRVLKDNIENVSVPDMLDPDAAKIISLEKESQHLIPFHSVENHIDDENVCLL